MKQKTDMKTYFVVIVVIVGLFALIYLVSNQGPKETANKVGNAIVKKQAGEAASLRVSTVEIINNRFKPDTITILEGGTVRFINRDRRYHRVITDPHPLHDHLIGFDSGDLAKGNVYTYIFNKKGTYTYHDEYDPLEVQGSIVVK